MINRRTLILSSLVFALITTISILGWGIIRKTQLDSSSQILALETAETLLKAGNREAMLLSMNESNFEADFKESLATRLFSLKRRVGVLQTIDSFTGTSDVPLLPFLRPATAFYQLELSMVAGPITMAADLVWTNSNWQFTSINFTGDVLRN